MPTSEVNLQFWGAANTVTGSRYLVRTPRRQVLVDCGLFQGYKLLRERNWRPFPVDPSSLDAVLLTHAHLDHSGYLPALVAHGFKGEIHCSEATAALCEVLWLDAAHLQEEEAKFRNRHGSTKHHPALPLFDTRQARAALKRLRPVELNQPLRLDDIAVRFHLNGHILGSCFLDVEADGRHILFTGDMGRPQDVLMRPPEPPCYADYLVVESTYGDRLHPDTDAAARIAEIINETVREGGTVLVPAFAVGRAQALMRLLTELRRQQRIPAIPVYLDSPMAINVTDIFCRYDEWHGLSPRECQEMNQQVQFTRSVEESQALNDRPGPKVIIAGSGMATGGRILHHLKYWLGKHTTTVMFTGFQAGGTRGDRLLRGEPRIKIHGEYYRVNARIENLDMLSAHADHRELLAWLRGMPVAPKHSFVTHGEPAAADAMRLHLQEELGWTACVPDNGEAFTL